MCKSIYPDCPRDDKQFLATFLPFFPSLSFSERAEMAVLWPHAPEIPLLNLSDDHLVLNSFWSFAALFFHRSVAGSVPLPQNHCFQIIQPSFLSMERFVSETFSNFCVTFSWKVSNCLQMNNKFFLWWYNFDRDPNNKMKLSNMFPKHKHNDQIIKHVSKTKTQRSNYQISQTQRLNYQTCDGECPKHSRANSFWKKNST